MNDRFREGMERAAERLASFHADDVPRFACCDTWPKPCSYHEGWKDSLDRAEQKVHAEAASLPETEAVVPATITPAEAAELLLCLIRALTAERDALLVLLRGTDADADRDSGLLAVGKELIRLKAESDTLAALVREAPFVVVCLGAECPTCDWFKKAAPWREP